MPKSHPITVIAVILLAWIIIVPLPITAQFDTGYFYYSHGEQISLIPSTRWIAVDFVTGQAGAAAWAASQPALADAVPSLQPGLIGGQDFYLLPLENPAALQAGDIQSLDAQTPADGWVNPVFERGVYTYILTDEFMVQFQPGMDAAAINAYNAQNGVEIVEEIHPGIYVLRVLLHAGVNALTVANRYYESGNVVYSHPNFAYLYDRQDVRGTQVEVEAAPVAAPAAAAPELQFTPTDPYFYQAWHLNNTGYWPGSTVDADIDATDAWNLTLGSSSIRIAVLDDGMQLNHPDLAGAFVDPYDSVGDDFDPTPNDNAVIRATDSHGTGVTGVLAARHNNGLGSTGVCPQCSIIPVRIFYSIEVWDPVQLKYVIELYGTLADTTAAFYWAIDHGAHAISNSWTWGNFDSFRTAIVTATTTGRGGLGIVVLFAAANDYPDDVYYPGAFAATIPGMITVGASNLCDGNKMPTYDPCNNYEDWWGNNWGAENNVTAPGVRIVSTDLTGTDGIVTLPSPSGDYRYFNGTSAATPVTAGVVGLLLSYGPTSGLTAEQVRDRLMRTAQDVTVSGIGYDIASGFGRVNAYYAMTNVVTNSAVTSDLYPGSNVLSLPFSVTRSMFGSFTSTTDPSSVCSQRIANSLWYRYTPSYTQTVDANTTGSNYTYIYDLDPNDTIAPQTINAALNTVIGVYVDSGGGILSQVVCNDDSGGDTSVVSFSATAGTTYYFLLGYKHVAITGSDNYGDGVPNTHSLVFNISTSTPPPSATVTLEVDLQRANPAPHSSWAVPVNVIVETTGGTRVIDNVTYNLDTSGFFTITSLNPGEYIFWVKNAHTLAESVTATIVNGANNVYVGVLREGDTQGNNQVDLLDFSAFAAAYLSTPASPNWNANADFNGDTNVSLTDFSLLAASFGTSGDPQP